MTPQLEQPVAESTGNPQIDQLQAYADTILKDAIAVQNLIKTAKTQAKRNFYNKKMDKLRKDLRRLLAAIELAKISGGINEATLATSQ